MATTKKKTTKVAKASKKAPAKKGAAKTTGRASRALSSKSRKVAIRKVKTKTGKKRADSIKIADHTTSKKDAQTANTHSASRIPHKKELEAKAKPKKSRKISKPIKGLSVQEPKRELEKLSEGWELNKSETQISKLFVFPTFISALAFVAKITVHAEVLQHHPDIELSYGKVKVKLTTHSVDALTKLDFALAERIDGISLRM